MSTPLSLFATAPKYLEELLNQELQALGAQEVKSTLGGVHFQGELRIAYLACLWSRIANRILLPLSHFTSPDADALYRGIQAIDWSEHFTAAQTIAVDCNLSKSQLTHSHFCAQKVKDAIVDQFTTATGQRPSVDTEQPDIRINCFIKHDQANISLDLSGPSLHQRGYRLQGVKAPLKENLAAAILQRANWHDIAHNGGSFIDPLCGSGTLAIEAAMIAADRAPGLLRAQYGFLAWRKHDDWLWQNLLDDARQRQQSGLTRLPLIMGYDADPRAIDSARGNAERAGLGEYIVFNHCELQSLVRPQQARTGLVATNPPYGERLGEATELPQLYRQLGETLKAQFPGWRAAVITSDKTLGKAIGIRARRIHKLLNGALECQLLHFDIEPQWFMQYSKPDITTTNNETLRNSEGAQMFANRLRKNLKNLGRWKTQNNIHCYRVYDADMPEYALAIDVYENNEDTWVHVQEYAAPSTVAEDKALQRLQEAMAVIPEVLSTNEEHVFLKTRLRQKGSSQYVRQDNQQRLFEVEENELRFLVNFSDYLDTGLFLDHRPTRQLIGELARDRDFLNLFCYTATASVYAASGGARSTTSVDMSRTYLEWSKNNFQANNIDLRNHRFIQEDCLAWIEQPVRKTYGLIFLDPPTFSNSKRMRESFDVQRDHEWLIRQVMRFLDDDGVLIFSNNFRKFKMAQGIRDSFETTDITPETIPRDFQRNSKIHNCWRITHR
jgi:23S rRNA (guanine2445-N2)-methyltransferase / 23S rRNA (guanine2069-N7)-methyltransferase